MAGNGDNVSSLKPRNAKNHGHIIYLANMKVITTIYLNCRPDLRDEWLTGTEVDDAQDALASASTQN